MAGRGAGHYSSPMVEPSKPSAPEREGPPDSEGNPLLHMNHEGASAYLMKHPPKQMRDSEAHRALEDFLTESSDSSYIKTPQKQDEVLV